MFIVNIFCHLFKSIAEQKVQHLVGIGARALYLNAASVPTAPAPPFNVKSGHI
jgi:hypothetical protein